MYARANGCKVQRHIVANFRLHLLRVGSVGAVAPVLGRISIALSMLLVSFALGSCTSVGGGIAGEDAQLQRAVDAEWISSANITELEPEALRQSQGSAERLGDVLRLRLKNGFVLDFVNGNACEPEQIQADWEGCHAYDFVVYSPSRRLFVLMEIFYEGARILLIDSRSGETVFAPSLPVVSPNGERLVVYDWDEGTVQIISHSDSHLKLDWSW